MNFFKSRENGGITVFISLMLVSILSIGSLVLEAGRLQSARTQLNEAIVSSGTSLISNYDLTLNDRFGIMAFEDNADAKGDFNDYLSFNSDLDSTYKGNNVTRLYNLATVEMDGIYNMTYPSVMKRQILSKTKYIKSVYTYPINTDTLSSFWPNFRNKCQIVRHYVQGVSTTGTIDGSYISALKSVNNAFSGIYDYDKNCIVKIPASEVSLLPTRTGTVTDVIPEEEINRIQSTINEAKSLAGEYAGSINDVDDGVLLEETGFGVKTDLKQTRTHMSNIVSGKTNNISDLKNLAIKAIEEMVSVSSALGTNENAQTNMLVNSYISSTFSNRSRLANGSVNPGRGTKDATNFSAACAEYVFAGSNNEAENQKNAYWLIFYIRLIDNIYYISQHYNVNAFTGLTWAFYESLVDLEVLTTHKGLVPMEKNSLFLPLEKAGAIASNFSNLTVIENSLKEIGSTIKAKRLSTDKTELISVSGNNFSNYTDYISIALWFVPNTDKMLRISDLIQLEMRYRQKYVTNESVTFLMRNQNTYCRANVTAKFNSILPIVSLGGTDGTSMGALKFDTVKFVGY